MPGDERENANPNAMYRLGQNYVLKLQLESHRKFAFPKLYLSRTARRAHFSCCPVVGELLHEAEVVEFCILILAVDDVVRDFFTGMARPWA